MVRVKCRLIGVVPLLQVLLASKFNQSDCIGMIHDDWSGLLGSSLVLQWTSSVWINQTEFMNAHIISLTDCNRHETYSFIVAFKQ